jgi:hypothetical protein
VVVVAVTKVFEAGLVGVVMRPEPVPESGIVELESGYGVKTLEIEADTDGLVLVSKEVAPVPENMDEALEAGE